MSTLDLAWGLRHGGILQSLWPLENEHVQPPNPCEDSPDPRPSASNGSHTCSMVESSELPLVRRKRLRPVGSASNQSGGEGQGGGDDQGKGRASPDIAGHGQS